MTEPLALVFYENLLPGTQVVNRLQDLGYRVHVVIDVERLVEQATLIKPLVVVADLVSQKDICLAISRLKQNPETSHLPVLAFTGSKNKKSQAAAQTAGASLVAFEEAILAQLPRLLDQVLQIE